MFHGVKRFTQARFMHDVVCLSVCLSGLSQTGWLVVEQSLLAVIRNCLGIYYLYRTIMQTIHWQFCDLKCMLKVNQGQSGETDQVFNRKYMRTTRGHL